MRGYYLIAAFMLAAVRADAAELRMITGGATLRVEEQLAEGFARETGHNVSFTSGTAGQVRERVLAGEIADVVAASDVVLQALEDAGAVVAGSTRVLARSGIGVGALEGAPLPDISTAENFRAAMLAARRVVITDPAVGASSGIATARIFDELGIGEAMFPKTLRIPGGYTAERVANGEAELAIQNMSEIIPVDGVVLVGPLPPELQHYTTYSAGIGASSASKDAARAFVEYLTRDAAAGHWSAAAMEPGPGS